MIRGLGICASLFLSMRPAHRRTTVYDSHTSLVPHSLQNFESLGILAPHSQQYIVVRALIMCINNERTISAITIIATISPAVKGNGICTEAAASIAHTWLLTKHEK